MPEGAKKGERPCASKLFGWALSCCLRHRLWSGSCLCLLPAWKKRDSYFLTAGSGSSELLSSSCSSIFTFSFRAWWRLELSAWTDGRKNSLRSPALGWKSQVRPCNLYTYKTSTEKREFPKANRRVPETKPPTYNLKERWSFQSSLPNEFPSWSLCYLSYPK